MSNKEEKGFTNIIIILSIIIITVALYFLMGATLEDKPLAGRGSEIDRQHKADIGGDFTLLDQNGFVFTDNQLNGKISMIYFGFSACPDICPTSLNKMAEVTSTLDKYGIDVTPVFVSLDPKRDTPEALKKYLAEYHSKFIGLTGDEAEIKKVADKFKVFFSVSAGSDASKDDYILDHTSLVYIMDKNGDYKTHFHLDTKPEEMIEYIRRNKN
jgi:protein SCO1